MILFSFSEYEYMAKDLLRDGGPSVSQGSFSAGRFSNGEHHVKIGTDVSGKMCAILGGVGPSGDDLVRTLLLCHTLKRSGARKITLISPYLSYSRQDKNEQGKSFAVPWLGDLARVSGFDEVVSLDIHSYNTVKAFSIPLLSLVPYELFLPKLMSLEHLADFTFVAPDEGAIDNCQYFHDELKVEKKVSYFRKERDENGELTLSPLFGPKSKKAIIVDDMLDTGKTLVLCCEKLKAEGVEEMIIVITHGIFSGEAWKELSSLGVKKIYCTDSIPGLREMEISSGIEMIILPSASLFSKYFGWKE